MASACFCFLRSLSWNLIGSEGAAALAPALTATGALTSLDLSNNALCGVAQDLFGRVSGTYTAEGITAIMDSLRVNGGLTVANLLRNELDAESAKMLAEVAKQKCISLCGIQRDQATADFCDKRLQPPDAILLASDLSQAVVTGGLTSLDLSSNQLCLWNLHCRGHHSGCRRSACQWRADGPEFVVQLPQG